MSPFEARVVVVGAAVILAIALWFFLPMIWRAHRRTVAPDPRLEQERRRFTEQYGVSVAQMAGIDVDEPDVAGTERRPRTLLSGWGEDWELEATNAERGDDPWPNIPASGVVFDGNRARPWAHA